MFFLYILFKGIFVLLLACIKCKRTFASLERFLDSTTFKQGVIRFFLETMFEFIICTLISFKMLEIKSIWNTADKVIFIVSMIVLTLSVIFLCFSFFVLLWVEPQLSQYKRQLK